MMMTHHLTSCHRSLPLVVPVVLFVWLSHPPQISESVLELSSCLLAVPASPSQLSFWPWHEPADGIDVRYSEHWQYTVIMKAVEGMMHNVTGSWKKPYPLLLDALAFLLDVVWGKGTILIPSDAIILQDTIYHIFLQLMMHI